MNEIYKEYIFDYDKVFDKSYEYTYTFTPECLVKPFGFLVIGENDLIIKSIKCGNNEQLISAVPGKIFSTPSPRVYMDTLMPGVRFSMVLSGKFQRIIVKCWIISGK